MLIDTSLSIREGLLLHKNIEPLEKVLLTEIKWIEQLDVTGFSEADVRGEIIDPIVRILGYKKGSFSSVDREKNLKFRGGKNKYIDYSLTLWKENFWLIEAKRPLNGDIFSYEVLSQAVEYSIHPAIGASVIVLCDGIKFELFDREDDLENPVLSFKICDLAKNFDNLRMILSPMQIWFFYKRRVLKSIDKAFESEFNIQRVNEFKKIIENRLSEKRAQVMKNFQSTIFNDKKPEIKLITKSSDDIIDGYFFHMHSHSFNNAMNGILLEKFLNSGGFPILYRIFPDDCRDANDAYYANALSFLIKLEQSDATLNWSPSWLDKHKERSVEILIKNLIRLSLTYFQGDQPRKTTLLAANAFRRIFKLLAVLTQFLESSGELRHYLTRLNENEFSWNQILSDPKRNILIEIDALAMIATERFVKDHSKKNGVFNLYSAKQQLALLWGMEKAILERYPNYLDILRERDFGEIHPTECASVAYDYLGHTSLCIIKESQKWKKYIIEEHFPEILALEECGSWVARELLESLSSSSEEIKNHLNLAERFFFGDAETQNFLSRSYGYLIN